MFQSNIQRFKGYDFIAIFPLYSRVSNKRVVSNKYVVLKNYIKHDKHVVSNKCVGGNFWNKLLRATGKTGNKYEEFLQLTMKPVFWASKIHFFANLKALF